jgi:hypothetical protein
MTENPAAARPFLALWEWSVEARERCRRGVGV